ncbi:MAG: dihydroorotase family protein, partial [Sulfolobales archaeon]|nr:dihydroorotase family protein [Sulfolobales archaeon]MDW8010985.1 dihydroorotase family protein [Sulfolobales archaeon]
MEYTITGSFVGVLLRGGAIVFRDAVVEADILVEEGKVARVGKSVDSGYSKTIDLRGRLVLPGAVDPHVHGREPGLEYKDDFYRTTRAAVLGGVTTVLDMPNTLPPVDSPPKLLEKKSLLSGKSYVDFALYAVLYDYGGDVESNIVELVKSGAVGFKAFMAQTTGNLPPPSFKTIYTALELSRKLGFTVVFHAENRECVEFFT